jgi:D-serine deaminase-like pyridoxal phosphate-dependent protein
MVPLLNPLETPVALVDIARARANAESVVRYAKKHGLAWRPHTKTHKSARIAALQVRAGASGLTVATLKEAEVMATVCDDLLLAYPPVGAPKLERLFALPSHVDIMVALDSAEVLKPLSEFASRVGRTLRVLIEIDVGAHRVGVQRPEQAVELAALAARSAQVRYSGVMFHPGHIVGPSAAQQSQLLRVAQDLEAFYQALSQAGFAPHIVSGGSTPTLWQSHLLPHLTEIRPGTCIYYDRDAVALHVAEPADWAYSVLASVVSVQVPNQAVIDAGSKALSKEPLTSVPGFGVVLEHPEVTVTRVSEEHGILDLSQTEFRPKVGDRVRIVPNHVCVSVNLQDSFCAIDAGTVERWPVDARTR